MRFLIDRCAGRRVADWLPQQGHDVVEARSLGPDPGDRKLIEIAAEDDRILVTIDTDFGRHVFVEGASHRGMVRPPDVPAARRVQLMRQVLERRDPGADGGPKTQTGLPPNARTHERVGASERASM